MFYTHLLTDPSFWILISFILFFLTVCKKGYKTVMATLTEYRETILKQINEAEALREEAYQMLRSEEKKTEEAFARLKDEEQMAVNQISQEKDVLKSKIKLLRKHYALLEIEKECEITEQARTEIEKSMIDLAEKEIVKFLKSSGSTEIKSNFIKKQIEGITS